MADQEKPDRGRLREIISILLKYKRAKGPTPEKLRAAIEELGPTFIKLGQLLSTRMDMFDASICAELSKLRVDVTPMPFSQVRQVLEEEYGRPPEEVFAQLDQQPLGSASIAQVHAALLPDGRRVAVKVQRPQIRQAMERDLALLQRACRLIKLTQLGETVDWNLLLEELWTSAQQETDFLLEARNADQFAVQNQAVPFVSCPKVIHALSTARILVMEYVEGISIDDREALLEAGYDLEEIGLKLADHYMKQALDNGFFHADPHPGNLRVRQGQIVFLDLGMMGRLTPRDRTLLRSGVKAAARGDANALCTVLLSLCQTTGPIDREVLSEDLAAFLEQYGTMEFGRMDLNQMAERMFTIARRHQLRMPSGVFLLCRGLLNLQGVLAAISPEIDLFQILSSRLSHKLMEDINLKAWFQEDAPKWLSSVRSMATLPASLSELLHQGAKGQLKLNVRLRDRADTLSAADRMVNKLVLSLITAALLIASSLLCLTDLSPRLLGLPWPACVGFGAAFLTGLRLILSLRKKKKR